MKFVSVFIASIFLSLHLGAVFYVNSSLLSNFFTPDIVSLLFFIGAVGNTILFLFAPKLIELVGKRYLLFLFLILTAISTFGLAVTNTWPLIALSFIIHSSLLFMIFYCLDIFLEEISIDTRTGEIRGAYLTFVHLGIILGLLILTLFSQGDVLKPVYLLATFLFIPPIILVIFFFKSEFPKKHGLHHRALLPYKEWWRSKSVRRVTLARFVLEFFYAFMTIYTPIYLHGILGFNWSIIGVIFIIMLLPFILLQWPVGKLADHFIGEKEMMIIGFLIMGISLLFMPYLEASISIWIVVLLCSRVGASLVETTTDSFFFKHVNHQDTGILSIFRLTRPISVVFGSGVGAIALNLFSFEKIFFVLAIVVFFGLKESLLIKDTSPSISKMSLE